MNRKATGGREALTERENVVDDVGDMMYQATVGGIGRIHDTTTPEERQALMRSVRAFGMPELVSLIDRALSREASDDFHDIDSRLVDLDGEIHDQLELYLDSADTAPPGVPKT